MGPQPQRAPGTHTETRYYIDAQGNIHQKQVQMQDREVQPQSSEPQYRYYRRPDGTVVRQQVEPAAAAAPAATGAGQRPHRPHQSQQQQRQQYRQPQQQPYHQPQQQYRQPQPQQQYRTLQPTRPTRPVTTRPAHRSPRWTPKRIAKHLVVIAIIALLLLWPSTIPQMRSLVNTVLTGQPAFQPFPEVAEITLERVNTLSSSGAISWRINISEPFNIPEIHEKKDLDTSPPPLSRWVDPKNEDLNWMHWEGNIASSGGTARITITYHMKLYSTLWEVDASDSGDVEDVNPPYSDYLKDEWKITPSDPQVQALSREIVGDETNVYNILLKIFRWMDENLVYETQRSSEPKSCSQTLRDGNGDCDDQSILLASLARAAGVPVWLNLGIIYDPVRNYWGGHGWNNVYIPLKNGDPLIATVDVVNDQFLFRDPYHVSDYLDNGDGDDLKDYYTSWSYSYNTGPFQPPPSVSSNEVYNVLDLKTTGSVVYTKP